MPSSNLEDSDLAKATMRKPVVLLHGMWSTGETLEPIRKRFEALGYQCWAPTLPHHENGGDAQGVGNLSLRNYISFLEKFIADQNFASPPLLVGHSMGGLLAQMLAARIPTAGLVLFAPGVPPGGIPATSVSQLRFFFPITIRPFWWKRAHRPTSFKAACSALFNNLAPARQRELFDLLVPESGRVLFELSFPQLDRTKAGAHDYSAVKIPVIILHGTKDGVVPYRGSHKLRSKYANVLLHEYPGAGHWAFEESNTSNAMFADLVQWLTAQNFPS
jgi:pimeloyl-ACP methyl ester carboxylesterase